MGGDVMRTVGTVAFALASLAISGCVGLDGSTVVSVTEMYSVTPANGVWDSEYGKTSAEITEEQKNAISHRGKALRAMIALFDEWRRNSAD